ncbi:MAG: hypothetical protein J6Q58_02810 [Clostridia bacterium]|nr:hypothetical protein [Clostridia bacterium]
MNNSKYENDFENLYITLEKMLHRITGIPDHIPVFPNFRAILDEPYYSQMETICNYRNACYGHGVKIGGERPIAPKEWIDFLKREICWVRNNQEYVREQILKRVPKKKKTVKVSDIGTITTAVECEMAIKKVLQGLVYYDDTIIKIILYCYNECKDEGIVVLYNVLKIIDESDINETDKKFCAKYLIEMAEKPFGLGNYDSNGIFYVSCKKSFKLLRGSYTITWDYSRFNEGYREATKRQREYFQKYLSIALKYVPDYEKSHLIE